MLFGPFPRNWKAPRCPAGSEHYRSPVAHVPFHFRNNPLETTMTLSDWHQTWSLCRWRNQAMCPCRNLHLGSAQEHLLGWHLRYAQSRVQPLLWRVFRQISGHVGRQDAVLCPLRDSQRGKAGNLSMGVDPVYISASRKGQTLFC